MKARLVTVTAPLLRQLGLRSTVRPSSSLTGMAQAVPVLRERTFANRRRRGLLEDAARHPDVLMARSVRFVSGRDRSRRRHFLLDRRHDRVDDPLGGPTKPGAPAGPQQGAHADDSNGGRAYGHVSAAIAH
jgi:hypothetical protein